MKASRLPARLRRLAVLPAALVIALPRCSGESPAGRGPLRGPADATVDGYLSTLPRWPSSGPAQLPDSPTQTTFISQKDALGNWYDYKCVGSTRHPVTAFNTSSAQPLFAPGLDNEDMKPGAIVLGSTFAAGAPKLARLGRSAVVLSIDLSLNGSTQITVTNPTSANLQDAVASLIARIPSDVPVIPANVDFNVVDAYTYAQSMNAIDVHGKYSTSFEAKFSDSLQASASRHAVIARLRQKLFTISFDPGLTSRPADMFGPSVTVADLQRILVDSAQAPDVPLYVKSVTYGRVFTMIATSDSAESNLELRASVDASYHDSRGDGSATTRQKAVLRNTSFVTRSFGGSEEAADAAMKAQDWKEFFSKVPPATAVPIAYYVVALVNDNPARLYDSNPYEESECDRPIGYTAQVRWDSVTTTGAPTGCLVDHEFQASVSYSRSIFLFDHTTAKLPLLTTHKAIHHTFSVPFTEPVLDSLEVETKTIDPPLSPASGRTRLGYPFNELPHHTDSIRVSQNLSDACSFRSYFTIKKVPKY